MSEHVDEPGPKTYTPRAAAKIFGVAVDTVRDWIRDGKLNAHNVGGSGRQKRYVIPPTEIERYTVEADEID